jgi:hypothetical protein
VSDENGDLLADFHNILNRWKNYFSELLNVHNVSDVTHTEVHTAYNCPKAFHINWNKCGSLYPQKSWH